MLKETITYVDFNGLKRTEDFYFNLSETELIEMAATAEGDLAENLKKIVEANDGAKIMAVFKDLMTRAYGVISSDGRKFEKKNGELAKEFFETAAYNQMFMRMVTDPEYASAFITGVIPKGIEAKK